ncbi:hypothetical protein P691DRAFT_789736 [Macrolepiota fuliginosa MF-IS2]|uniref:Uncharacterized protein n=1 Tax=Macrolepiota fuliginosa MF-IS2 TaxID=1400762 RepID=A0A9P5X125_9AGAR|nr:hypothetical protein P691DRAFT_789736 [Macrolepiota fuliginosa MF-IS2]
MQWDEGTHESGDSSPKEFTLSWNGPSEAYKKDFRDCRLSITNSTLTRAATLIPKTHTVVMVIITGLFYTHLPPRQPLSVWHICIRIVITRILRQPKPRRGHTPSLAIRGGAEVLISSFHTELGDQREKGGKDREGKSGGCGQWRWRVVCSGWARDGWRLMLC